ncbi:MAG TPA: lysophospholipid acyltransferase family protein [Anaeromyxobacter sp.]|nr:lysophospholipid acyltransferase family protein [Anaeromyxobacter sp.]
MTPVEAVGRAQGRLARAGARVAGLGLTTLATGVRLRRLGDDASTRDGARERARMLRDVARRVLDLHGVAVDSGGVFPLGPAVLVSNHVSWLDPIVVASQLPCVPVSKLDVARWPVIGTIARELGVVFVSRGDARSGARALLAAGAALEHELSVLNFPEGTTTDGASVLPFRPGMFGLAIRAGVPLVPLAIAYDPPSLAWVGDATFLPHYLGLAGGRGARATVRIGAPLTAAPDANAREVAREAHAQVAQLLQEIRCPRNPPSPT